VPNLQRKHYVQLSLVASLLLHLLLPWLYQQWAADQLVEQLQLVRFDQAPSTSTERFEARPRTAVPVVVMEQLRLSELLQLPEPTPSLPSPSIAPDDATPSPPAGLTDELRPEFLPGDTVSYGSTLQDLYHSGTIELGRDRLLVLPLVDVDSEACQRWDRAEQIIARAIEAVGGLENMKAIRDKKIRREAWDSLSSAWVPNGTLYYRRGLQYLE
jgi:hypothetical protein